MYKHNERWKQETLTEKGERDLLADTPGILKAPDHTQLEASLSLGVRHGELVDARQKVHYPVVVWTDVQSAEALVVATLVEMRQTHCTRTCSKENRRDKKLFYILQSRDYGGSFDIIGVVVADDDEYNNMILVWWYKVGVVMRSEELYTVVRECALVAMMIFVVATESLRVL